LRWNQTGFRALGTIFGANENETKNPSMENTPAVSGPTTKGKLAKKLAGVLIKINRVPKSGYNDFHRYKFVTESDLSDAVRENLGEAGVFIFTNVEEITQTPGPKTNSNKEQTLTRVKLSHTFVDGDSGESHTVFSYGEGMDGADKGIYKAITGATKYFLYKNFLISTGDDPERTNDAERGEQQQQRAAGGRQRTNPDGDGRSRTQQQPEGAGSTEQQQQKPAELPPIKESLAAGEDWKAVVIHFGKKYKGKKLGDLAPESLNAWANEWQPKPNPADPTVYTAEDVRLRRALNSYKSARDSQQ
jgi:hypothetical protein